MPIETVVREALEGEERRSVGDAFGGAGLARSTFSVPAMTTAIALALDAEPEHPASRAFRSLQTAAGARATYILRCAIRFAFLIELTNLSITSTKIKTRWLPGEIQGVAPGGFQNIRREFSPGNDPRAASFDACFEIFVGVLTELNQPNSNDHLQALLRLAVPANRSLTYEFVFTYTDGTAANLHSRANIRLVNLNDLNWLTTARPLFASILSAGSRKKITTKTFKTDRAQTGAGQTNRAKRWEVSINDFQHAGIEDCWQVERTLLGALVGFETFPAHSFTALTVAGIAPNPVVEAFCPVTLQRLSFEAFQEAQEHGRAAYQVGHLTPLKSGGRHTGTNVAWITDDGNRIQGDYDIARIHELLHEICARMTAREP